MLKPNHDDPKIKEQRSMQFADGPMWIWICSPAWASGTDKDGDKYFNESGPVEIAHDCGSRIWFWGSYCDHLPDGAIQVGDGQCTGYDQQGNRLISIPEEWCRFITEEEAHTAIACMAEDEKLLGYAR